MPTSRNEDGQAIQMNERRAAGRSKDEVGCKEEESET